MRKAFTIILAALLLLSVFVSCNQDDLVDDLFNSSVHVTFDSNGGSGSMAVQEMKGKTATALSANAFTKEGYLFLEWNTKADGSGTAYADGASVSLDSDITLYAQWIAIITSSTTALDGASASEYKLLDDVTIDSRVTVTGTVSINLAEGKTLTIPKGIRVSEGNSLTITGTGTLYIELPEEGNAGIGGNKDENCGTVIIEGGRIVAQCGFGAAGIGGGYAETAGGNGGIITINGGEVVAVGAYGSPGIGSGTNESGASVLGGNITITGGIVHVATGQYSAAIGGGDGANSGKITINGGTVRILCDLITTTIGAGRSGTNGDITISDDVNILSDGAGPDDDKVLVVFKANGGEGTIVPMIMDKSTATALPANDDSFTRRGYAFSGWNTKADGTGTPYEDEESVSLDSDTTLYAQWVDLSIITSSTTVLDGASVSEYKLLDDVTINSRVTVTGTVSINLAEGKTLTIPKGIRVSEGNSLTIKGKGTLEIEDTEDFNAGIGGNKDENCGTVIIEGGSIEARCGGQAAGIGGGNGGNSGTIRINGGVVRAMGGLGCPGIGNGTRNSAEPVSGGNITITGGTVHVVTTDYSAAIGGGNGADSGTITINGGTVRIQCNSNFLSTTIGAGPDGTNGDITISDDVNILSDGGGYVLVVFKANGGEGTIVPMIMEKSTATALPANTFTRSGYAFSGWNTKADGTGTSYANGQSVSLDSDITLYAQW